MRSTDATRAILEALVSRPESYGREIMTATGYGSGTVYPVLRRLAAAGWVTSRRETGDPSEMGRPLRRYYLLTADGRARVPEDGRELRAALARVRAYAETLCIPGHPEVKRTLLELTEAVDQ